MDVSVSTVIKEPVKSTEDIVGETANNNYQQVNTNRTAASLANSNVIESKRVKAKGRVDCGDDNYMEVGGDGSQDKPLPPQHEGKPKSLHCCHWSRGSYKY